MTTFADVLLVEGEYHAAVTEARHDLAKRLTPLYPAFSQGATVRVMLRFCRGLGPNPNVKPALRDFETAVRPSLVTYVKMARLAGIPVSSQTEFLIEHFDQFTEVPINASLIKRVVSWARRNYRAWRKADG